MLSMDSKGISHTPGVLQAQVIPETILNEISFSFKI